MSDDIVTRLRRFTANNADWPTIANAAAEIERLRSDLSIFRGVAHELDRIRGQLREAAETLERLYTENEQLAAENERLRTARDEWIAGTVHHARRANGETE